MLVQVGLCRTCLETTLLVFQRGGSNGEIPATVERMISGKNVIFCINITRSDCNGCCQIFTFQCWESYFGQQIYKLVLLDLIVETAIIVFIQFPRR